MTNSKQLWLLTGGNGAGKSTFYRMFLAPRGVKPVNADLIAKEIDPKSPEKVSYAAAQWAQKLIESLVHQGVSFCYETIFSHPSKIDVAAKAKALGYQIILVYIHLDIPALNEARVHQRVTEGGHAVPADKIHRRIPRTMENVVTLLPLANEVRLLNNSSYENPFQQVATVRRGRRTEVVEPLPEWAKQMMMDIP